MSTGEPADDSSDEEDDSSDEDDENSNNAPEIPVTPRNKASFKEGKAPIGVKKVNNPLGAFTPLDEASVPCSLCHALYATCTVDSLLHAL